MKAISNDDLKEILRKHALWVMGDPKGQRADLRETELRSANLYRANLRGANLSEACLYGADLRGADLREADLTGVNLRGATLYRANLCGAHLHKAGLGEAYLYGANLSGADLYGANLSGADLRRANLYGANLYGANLRWADLREADDVRLPIACPEEGSFIGFKKCRDELIVKLEIPADALRCSATTRKCRCSKAKVLSITNIDGSDAGTDAVASKHDNNFIYKVGETVEVPDFNRDRWNECTHGIHFFVTRQEAVEYNL